MDFMFRFINVVLWLLVLAVLWAIFPYLTKFLQLLQTIHDFGK